MVQLNLTLLQIILAASAVLTKSVDERMNNCNVGSDLPERNANNAPAWRGYITSDPMSLADADYQCRNIIGGRLGSIVSDDDWFEFCRLLRMYASNASFWTSGIYDPESSISKWEINDVAVPPSAPVFPSDPDQLTRIILYRKNLEEILP